MVDFSRENIIDIFHEFIQFSPSTGIDGLSVKNYRNILNKEALHIEKNVFEQSYRFSIYKQKLISKGPTSNPRVISIPTIRDKIVLKILSKILFEKFSSDLNFRLAQDIVQDIKRDRCYFDSYLKIDVQKFFDSIKHDELEKRYWRRIRNHNILKLLHDAIRTGTGISKNSTSFNEIGVPQGLSISNFLSELYMINFDRKMRATPNIKYYRYVDDIIIFYNKSNNNEVDLFLNVKDYLKKRLKLKIHELDALDSKTARGSSKDFSYLGYKFGNNKLVSARQGSIQKLYNSLVSIFVSYCQSQSRSNFKRRQSKEFLLWRLNLRITGCIFEQKKRGWLFFFQEINDEKLLHRLDSYIRKLKKRFNIDIPNKTYVRSFKELTLNYKETTYIPNYDGYSNEQKKRVLERYFSINTRGKTEEIVDFLFKKRLGKQVSDLLMDVRDFY